MDVIEVERLHKRYGTTVAVEDVSFTVAEGEIFGLLGPNGAGKTTTVECLSGLRRPDGGRVRVLGCSPGDAELRDLVGVQLQESALPDRMRVGEALALYRAFYRDPVDLTDLGSTLGLSRVVDTPFGKLSGGERQRLSIALALLGRPRIAILDELTTGLDPQARRATWELIERIRDQGVTIVLVTHFMEEAERLCDRVAVIHAGRVAALDAPHALSARLHTTLRFRPSAPMPDLRAVAGVSDVTVVDGRVIVTGGPGALQGVLATLAGEGVVAEGLRVEQAGLEDAFIELTGGAA